MKSEEIIRSILQRYKEICAKYPQSPSFIPNKKGDSFYLIRNFDTGKQPTQIRLSNHGTSLKTWVDRDELGESVERINPAFSINISIVFVDEGKNLTKDCIGQQNCENCQIVPCIPETFEGQDELGRAFTVTQYAYRSKYIRERYINGITKAIAEASVNGKYVDPLIALYRAAKEKTFHSSTQNQASNNQEIKENRNMNKKQVIRLNENQLKQIVMESVKRVLKESKYDGLSQDDWDNLYRSANDKVLSPDYHNFRWQIFKLNGVGFEKQMEESDRYAFYQSEEEALNDGLKHLKKYSKGTYGLYLSDAGYELRNIITHNGKKIRDEGATEYGD